MGGAREGLRLGGFRFVGSTVQGFVGENHLKQRVMDTNVDAAIRFTYTPKVCKIIALNP